MDMKSQIAFMVLLAGLVSCANTSTEDAVARVEPEASDSFDLSGLDLPKNDHLHLEDALPGYATPWILERDSSRVPIYDWFPELEKVDSVCIAGERFDIAADGTIFLEKSPKRNGMFNMEVYYEGLRYDFPLFADQSLRVTWDYKPSNPKAKKVEIVGAFTNWVPVEMKPFRDGYRHANFLREGKWEYQFVEDGKWVLDPKNPLKADNGSGGFNSVKEVESRWIGTPMMYADEQVGQSLVIRSELKVDSLMTYWEDQLMESVKVDDYTFVVTAPEIAKQKERSHLVIWGCKGVNMTNNLLIPLASGEIVRDPSKLDRHDRQTNIMYFAMVDRFYDGDPSNNAPVDDPSVHPKANHMGGDLQGLTQQIEAGYFNDLGVNTLWISPVAQNAEGAWGLWDEGIRSTFSGYHGYWPVSSSQVDRRLGSNAALNTLISTSHANGMNVFLDYVANHVHEDHPVFQAHKDWATDLYLPDGSLNTEKWDEHRLTTWFDTFLPTLDFSKPEVVDAMTDSALHWVTAYDLDGFRHDATKHIDEEFWRTLTRKMKAAQSGDGTLPFQIGETYGSNGLVRSYLSTGMLDAQFDFNLYDCMLQAFIKGENNGWDRLRLQLKENMTLFGFHNAMGHMTGNQDRPRVISLADGSVKFGEDTKLAGWTREIENQGELGHERVKAMMTFLMTVPGIPCIYYGDEIGMPGGNDPDNRRMMQFDKLDKQQKSLRKFVSELTALRREHMVFMYGDTHALPKDEDFLILFRKWFDEEVLVVFYDGEGRTIKRARPEEYVDVAKWKGHWGGKLKNIIAEGEGADTLEITLPKGQNFEIFFRKK